MTGIISARLEWVKPDSTHWQDLSSFLVTLYTDRMREGQVFPPPVLIDLHGSYMSLDGAHRMEAAKRLGIELEAWVISFDQMPIIEDVGRKLPGRISHEVLRMIRCGDVTGDQLAQGD